MHYAIDRCIKYIVRLFFVHVACIHGKRSRCLWPAIDSVWHNAQIYACCCTADSAVVSRNKPKSQHEVARRIFLLFAPFGLPFAVRFWYRIELIVRGTRVSLTWLANVRFMSICWLFVSVALGLPIAITYRRFDARKQFILLSINSVETYIPAWSHPRRQCVVSFIATSHAAFNLHSTANESS